MFFSMFWLVVEIGIHKIAVIIVLKVLYPLKTIENKHTNASLLHCVSNMKQTIKLDNILNFIDELKTTLFKWNCVICRM